MGGFIVGGLLYSILKELRIENDRLQRISLGLFPVPNGGLDKLVYLQLIHDQLEKMAKTKREPIQKMKEFSRAEREG